jgi:LVIVD repeat-containing protein
MTRTWVRHVCAAAFACGIVALAPAAAGAHPVEGQCAVTALLAAPTPQSASGACASDTATTTATDRVARPARAPAHRKRGDFKQVGHEPLLNRGMHAAIAVHDDYAYIGARTDAHAGTPHGGIMVVDISRPSRPKLTGPPIDARPGESTRELRVWHSQDILIDLNTNCGVGPTLHHCTQASISNIRFYDISGRNARTPQLINQLDVDTHEFVLWQDPKNSRRALIFAGAAATTCATRGGKPSCPFSVWDISPVRRGQAPVTLFSGLHGYSAIPGAPGQPPLKPNGGLHSLSLSNDGRTAYFALLTGGFAIVDTSEFANGSAFPMPHPITTNEGRPTWAGPGAHSALKLWGRDWAWVSDEVYGTATAPGHGCPWGWARMVDISDPTTPTVEADYRTAENDPSTCADWNPPRTSYSAHNPTLTPHIAFSTWHSEGLEAVSVASPRTPYRLAEFSPKPLASVMLEDPRLSSDPDTGRDEKVVMWSYPIIQDGLIYVIDLRNGLYVLKYRGAYEREVSRIGFLEGNSNQGDALCYEPVGRAPRYCR